MAKKKSSQATRKHQFKYAAPPATVAGSSAKASFSTSTNAGNERDFSYVLVDLRRIALLGGGLVILQLVLWYIFNHTGLGPATYNLVKL
jgi:hypothetical protein